MEITFENYQELKELKLTRAQIAARFDIPEWKLKKHIATSGWGKSAPVVGNERFFETFSEESCYWAGFLAADGNVDYKGRVRLMLKYDDILHLEKFRKAIKSTHAISSNTEAYNRCSFEFTNPDMCGMLDVNFNIVPNKTDKYVLPEQVPAGMFRHFLRGYFDGDGSVCESFSNVNSITATLYATFCSGSFQFAERLFRKLNMELALGGHLQDFGTGKKWQIKYNTNDAIVLLRYLYTDSTVYLDRKYHIFDTIVNKGIRAKRDNGIVHSATKVVG